MLEAPVKMRPLNDWEEHEEEDLENDGDAGPEEEQQDHQDTGVSEDPSMEALAAQAGTVCKQLKMAQRKGMKKQVEVFDVLRASDRLAKEIVWGPLKTTDERKAYVPEAGQRSNDIPPVWQGKVEEQVELKFGRVAIILMMPSFPTVVACQPITANFRLAYMGIAHDVLLRQMKKAAYCFDKETEKKVTEDVPLDEEDEDQPPQQDYLAKAEPGTGKKICSGEHGY